MLLNLRDSLKQSKIAKYVFGAIIVVPFALFGIGSYFGGTGFDYAAEVNGEEVPVRDFERALRQQQQQMRQMFGGKVSGEMLNSPYVLNQAMENVVLQKVLTTYANEQGYATGNEELGQFIVTMGQLQKDGAFDQERYDVFLRSIGMTTEGFEEALRADLTSSQLYDSVSSSAFTLTSEVDSKRALQEQKRTINVATLTVDSLKTDLQASEDEIQTYFNEHQAQFRYPEKVQLDYLELTSADLVKDVDVTDEAVAEYFEQIKDEYILPEERTAAHILIELEEGASEEDDKAALEKIQALKQRIDAGEVFTDVAKSDSQDIGSAEQGGDLGSVTRGVMVEAFDNALFAMSEGEVSEPVKTEYGYHIIQLNKIKPEKGRFLDDVKDEVTERFKSAQAAEKFTDLSEQLGNLVYENNGALDPAADALGLDIQSTEWIDKGSQASLGQYPAVMQAAFSDDVLKERLNSDVLSVGENHAVVVRVKAYEAEKDKPLEEVKETVEGLVLTKKAQDLAEEKAKSLQAKVVEADFSEAADAEGFEVKMAETIERQGSELNPSVVRAAFRLPKPQNEQPVIHKVRLDNGDQVVMALTGVETPELDASEDIEASPANATAEYNAWVQSIRSRAEVSINTQLLTNLSSAQ